VGYFYALIITQFKKSLIKTQVEIMGSSKSKKLALGAIVAVTAAAFLLSGLSFAEDQTYSKQKELLESWRNNEYEGLKKKAEDEEDPQKLFNVEAQFALVTFYLADTQKHIDDVNTWLANYDATDKVTEFGGSGDPSPKGDNVPGYWSTSLIWKIYLDPQLREHLSKAAIVNIRKMMFRFIKNRSKVADADVENDPELIWKLHGSENHDINKKAAYFLAVQALRDGSYGDGYDENSLLNGTEKLAEHYEKWVSYWKTFFKTRAKEGLQLEVASPTYEMNAVANYYNIRDYAEDPELRRLADSLITLHWADTAQDFVATSGIRGGAITRHYKKEQLIYGKLYPARKILYTYGWLDLLEDEGYVKRMQMIPLTSLYRPPEIVNAIATELKEEPYHYASRRFGMGYKIPALDDTRSQVTFDSGDYGNESNIRRDTYTTPEYVMGTMTWDLSEKKEYIPGHLQNRSMGVYFGAHRDARILVVGKGSGQEQKDEPLGGTVTGYREILGILSDNCMVVGRDPEADELENMSEGTRVYISNAGGLLENMEVVENWIFTHTDTDPVDAYVGIRIAAGGYTTKDVPITGLPVGKMLDLINEWSPIVIQMGRACDYDNFTHFKTSVADNNFVYEYSAQYGTDVLHYTSEKSEKGDVFKFWSNDYRTPKLNGERPPLNPYHTYFSPYIEGIHGEETITIKFPGFDNLELDFSESPPPVADFTASPTEGEVPLRVEFKDQSSRFAGAITGWEWNFDNDENEDSTLQNPIHTYDTPSTYTATLTVTGPGGNDTETKTDYITVTHPPVANFTTNQTTEAPLRVIFTNESTGYITGQEWFFGDNTTSYQWNTENTYGHPGNYRAGLFVFNDANQWDFKWENINAYGVDFTYTKVDTYKWQFEYQGSSLFPGDVISQRWNFGHMWGGGCEGQPSPAASGAVSPTHWFPSSKTYNVTLTVTVGGVTYTKTKPIYID